MSFQPPDPFNIAHYFLTQRIEEGRGGRTCLRTDVGHFSYADIDVLANRFANLLHEAGVRPEERVLIALPDSADFVGALFGVLKLGAVAVIVNPHLKPSEVEYFFEYTRASAAVVHGEVEEVFNQASGQSPLIREILVVGEEEFVARLGAASATFDIFPTHADDAAIWIFSGGTTGNPKAAVQSHRSFANTTEYYAKQVVCYGPDDVTLSVPKLYFGYAMGANLFFPMAAGGCATLFADRCLTETLFAQIEKHRPSILINVPTMVNHMVTHASAPDQDLSCLRLATSAGEALPLELHERWNALFGCDLLDGLGTAEMWHVFISNRPGDVRPGTLGTVVPGFEVRVCDDEGLPLPDGQVGTMWVRGDSLANGYWQRHDKTRHAFRGEWYVSGDMIQRDADGTITYCGRADDMLKVSGKWLSPREVENCLLGHSGVAEAAVVGVVDESGLTKPFAFVIPTVGESPTESELQEFVRGRLAPHKYPRSVIFKDDFPRTHLGKVDRGRLRGSVEV
jgi:benzoate-CoA ligase family protein